MNTVIALIIKDFKRFFADKTALILTFIVPILLILIFGNIFSSGGGSRGKIDVILINNSNSKIALLIEAKLDSSNTINTVKQYSVGESMMDINEEKAREFISTGKMRAAIILPENFLEDDDPKVNIDFLYDPSNEIEMALIQGTIQQTIMSNLPGIFPYLLKKKTDKMIGAEKSDNFMATIKEQIGKYFDVDPDSITSLPASEEDVSLANEEDKTFFNNLINFNSEQLVGEEVTNPGVTRIVGGWAIMFLLFSLTGAATSLFEEKQEGTLKRLLCMPVQRSHILWSKYIYSMLLGIVQLMVMFLFAWLVFNVDIFSNFFNLMLVIISSSAAAVAFGMIITSFAKSLSQANGIATLLILVTSALGGSWFPVSLFPDWMQIISKVTLTYWSVEAFQQVLWRQAGIDAIAPYIVILLSIAFIVNFYSLLRFRNGKVL